MGSYIRRSQQDPAYETIVVIRALKKIHTKAAVQLFITLMYRVRDEMIHVWTTEGKTTNKVRMPFLNEWCTNNFKDLEVAVQIWLSIERVTISILTRINRTIYEIHFDPYMT